MDDGPAHACRAKEIGVADIFASKRRFHKAQAELPLREKLRIIEKLCQIDREIRQIRRYKPPTISDEIKRGFIKKEICKTHNAKLIRSLGIRNKYAYIIKRKFNDSIWRIISEFFVEIGPKTYITTHPKEVIRFMKILDLW